MLTGLASWIPKAKFLVNQNSTTILTGVGVTGTVATAYLTGRASFKAAHILEKEKRELEAFEKHELREELVGQGLGKKELTMGSKVKLVWHLYILPFGVGLTTVVSIITANRISSKKIAALALASGISERAFQEYKEKVIEKLGAKQDEKIRDEIAQDRVSNNPIGPREVILAGTGEVLCYDMTSGRYFQSTVEEIKRAENRINYELIHFMSASLSMFYEEIGLPPTTHSDSVGWNMNNKTEVLFSTTLSSDGRPCLAIDFSHQPVSGYDKMAWDG
jgi:hypothetical protein